MIFLKISIPFLCECTPSVCLHHDVAKVVILDNIVGLYDVGVFDRCEGFLFPFEEVLCDFIIDFGHLNGLNSNGVIVLEVEG